MGAIEGQLYRYLSRCFPVMKPDDVFDAINEARGEHLRQSLEFGRVVENVAAYTTVVARRSLARAFRRRLTIVSFEQAGDGVVEAATDRVDVARFDEEERALDATVDAARILTDLPPQYAQVLRMHYLEGLTLDETSRRLGCTAQSVRKRHERALRWARKRFSR
jgi:RNA polymerase sigma factor (sigma-70 family)